MADGADVMCDSCTPPGCCVYLRGWSGGVALLHLRLPSGSPPGCATRPAQPGEFDTRETDVGAKKRLPGRPEQPGALPEGVAATLGFEPESHWDSGVTPAWVSLIPQ